MARRRRRLAADLVWIAPNDGTVPSAVQSVIAGYFTAVAGASPVWIAGFFAPPPAAIGATPICISGWSGSGGGGGAATSVWSASDAAANGMTLSNGGLTVTPQSAAAWYTIRSSISKTSGKLYVEFYGTGTPASTHQMFGLANASFTPGSNNYLGSENYSVGLQGNGGTTVSPGFTSNYGSLPAAALNDVWALAVDFTAGSIWIAKNNIWVNSSNPATGSLPIVSFVPATVGALFAAMSLVNDGGVWTLQPTAAAQKYLPPPGFQAWDGGPVTPPASSVWSASDAAANAMTLSNGGLTVTPTTSIWQSVRGTISRTTGKYYAEFLLAGSSDHLLAVGIASTSFVATNYLSSSTYSLGGFLSGGGCAGSAGFNENYNTPITAVASGDVLQIAVDLTTGSFWMGLNNTWMGSSNPGTGTAPMASIVAPALGLAFYPAMSFSDPAAGVWTLQPTPASQHYLPPPGFQAWDGGPVTPPATSVWSSADAAANAMTLSNGGLTVKGVGSAFTPTSIRGTSSKTSGKLYVEFLVNATNSADYDFLGLASAGFNPAAKLGDVVYSGGGTYNATNVSAGFTSNYTGPLTPAINDVWALAVDFATGNVWLAQNNVWVNSSNPATGSLPFMAFVPATVGALFPALSIGTNEMWTLQATAASQKYAPPAGFSAQEPLGRGLSMSKGSKGIHKSGQGGRIS